MPKPVDYDLSQISAHVITYSDRIQRGTKEDRATPACTAALAEAGLGPVTVAAIPESADILETEIRDALEARARFILVLGGSGFGVGNYAPEVVRSIVEVEIPGIAEQIRAHGLANTPLSGLSREVVGVTARDSSGALIISSPGSSTSSANPTSSKERGLGSLVSGGGGKAWPGFEIDHSEPQARVCRSRGRAAAPGHQKRTRPRRRPPASIRGGRLFVRMTVSPTRHRLRDASHQATSSGVSMSRHTSALTFTRSTSRARKTRRTPTPRTDPRTASASLRTRRSAPAR